MPIDPNTEKFIKIIALKNSVEHGGNAQSDAVIAKFVGLKPELRSQIKLLISEIKAVVQQINALSLADQKSLLEELAPSKVAEKKSRYQTRDSSCLRLKEPCRARWLLDFRLSQTVTHILDMLRQL